MPFAHLLGCYFAGPQGKIREVLANCAPSMPAHRNLPKRFHVNLDHGDALVHESKVAKCMWYLSIQSLLPTILETSAYDNGCWKCCAIIYVKQQ